VSSEAYDNVAIVAILTSWSGPNCEKWHNDISMGTNFSKLQARFDRQAVVVVAIFPFFAINQLAAAAQLTAPIIRPLERPDPASITVPNLGNIRGSDSYFYFHKPHVSYEAAFAHLDQCRIYSLTTPQGFSEPPQLVPLGTDFISERQAPPPISTDGLVRFGLVGVGIGVILAPILLQETADATIKRCMSYKGYKRYGTSRSIWNQINSGTEAERLGKMALIASGPQPTTQAFEP
jgi:hypothetical protein